MLNCDILIMAMALCCNLSCEDEDIELNAILRPADMVKDCSGSVYCNCESVMNCELDRFNFHLMLVML